MSDKKTQILYTPDTRAIDELGANWHNIVNEIDEYLKSEGFSYSRTLGFVREGDSSDEEMQRLIQEIVNIGLGPEYFVAVNSYVLENEIEIDFHALRHKAAEMEANGETPDFEAMLREAFGTDDEE